MAAFGDKGMVREQLRDVWRWTVETENAFQRMPHGQILDCLSGILLQTGGKSKMAAYAVFMARRLVEMRRVLKPAGTIYLHCDTHANAYLRILMDTIFGVSNFRNEIIWCYSGGGQPRNDFPRKHDTILRYSKTKTYTFNKDAARVPYDSDYRATVFTGEDTRAPGRTYRPHPRGKVVEDWWRNIPRPYGEEVVGYPTQKPLALLERIISASSDFGDLVLDPFCGCGTAADAAASLGRKYLGIDISGIAVRVMQQRLESRGAAVAPVVYRLDWSDYEWKEFERRALQSRDESEDGTPGWAWAEDKVAGLLNAVPNARKHGDGGVDARYFGALDTDRNESIIIPIQVKMHRNRASVGRPDMDRLLGTQAALQNRGLHAPMSIMVSLYPPPKRLRVFAAEQGRVTLTTREAGTAEYPKMQVLSVQEMLQREERPNLPPVDPRALVGNTQDKMLLA